MAVDAECFEIIRVVWAPVDARDDVVGGEHVAAAAADALAVTLHDLKGQLAPRA